MKILYVLGGLGDEGIEPLSGLVALDPDLRIEKATGAAAAIVELRSRLGYQAVILSPRLSAGETLGLIATLRRDHAPVAIVPIIGEDQQRYFAQAIAAGADDVLVLREDGLDTPRETLRRIRGSRHIQSRREATEAPEERPEGTGRRGTERTEIPDVAQELTAAQARLANQERLFEELQETLAFERAMRNRDREEMARLRQSLLEERERRVVLEGTLRHTEDRSADDSEAIKSEHAAVVDRLERHIEQLQDELTTRTAERDRLIQHDLFGWATVTAEGVLVACNSTFAQMFGFDDPADAIAEAAGGLAGLTDHEFLVARLREGKRVDRVSSVLRRRDGRTFRVLTSAAFLSSSMGEAPLIERILIDLDDRSRLDEQLRLARRLETAGRLTAEMSSEIEALLPSLDDPAAEAHTRRRVALMIRQLIAFTRHQAQPAGLLSLTDAIRRAEPRLRQIGGDLAPVTFDLEDAGSIAASEDDVEQLLSALAFAAAACLPYGGSLTFRTQSSREGFEQCYELSVTATGYGVLPISLSSSLTRLVTKCGGTVRSTDDPARSTTLHVFLPC